MMKFALTLVLSCFLSAALPAVGIANDNGDTPGANQSQTENVATADEEFVDVFDVGEQKLKELDKEKPTEPKDPVTPEPLPKKQQTPPLRVGGAVTLGLGAAALIAGAVTGGLALSLDKSLDSEKCPDNQCYAEYSDDVDRRDSLSLATDILLIAGSTATIAGVLMVVFSYPEFRRSEKKGRSEAITVRPIVGRTFVGTSVTWSF
jgi:hypothetical protein